MAKGRGDAGARVGRAGLVLATLFAVFSIAANVAIRVGARAPSAVRELAPRLELAWVLLDGSVSGWHVRSHDGPIVQLLLAPYAFASPEPTEVAVASTLTTLLLSLALAWLAVRAIEPHKVAVIGCVAILLLAVHHALDAPAALAALLAVRVLADARSLRAEVVVVLLVLFAIGWSPLVTIPIAATLLASALARVALRAKDAVGRGIRTVGLVGIVIVLWLAVAPWVGGRSDVLLDGAWLSALERAPRPSAAVILFVVLGGLGAGRMAWTRRDEGALVRLSGAVAFAIPALLGWRLHEVGSLLWPLAATIAMEGWRWRGEVKAQSSAAIGWAALFALGWVPSHAGTFSLHRWLELREAIDAPRDIPDEEDVMVAWARAVRRAHPDDCVVWPVDEGIARLRARARGPIDPLRAVRTGEQRAAAIERARCRFALSRIEPFERDGIGPDGWFVGPDRVAIARDYRPSRSLSPTLVVAERRAAPRAPVMLPLTLRSSTASRSLGDSVDVRFLHPIPGTWLVRLSLRIDAWPLEAWLGAPRLLAQPLVRGEPNGAPVPLPPLPAGRQIGVLVSTGDAATWAWTRGTRATPPEIDGVRISVDPSDARLGPLAITVSRAEVLTAPLPEPFDRAPRSETCAEDASLLHELLGARAQRVDLVGSELRIPSRADAVATEVSARVRPCANQCLFAEAGLADGTTAAHLTLESIGAAGAESLVDQRLTPGWRRPIVVPLPADEPLWLRFAVAEAEGGARELTLFDPRVAPCTALFEVVHALHQGEYARVPDDTVLEVIGDELRLPLRPVDAIPPRVEVPLPVSFGDVRACVAVDLALRDASGPAGLMVGVRTDDRVYWLERRVVTVEDPLLLVREAPLQRFAGQTSALVFSAWPIGEDSGGTALFIRPRVYDCDREAGWSFGSGR